MAIKLLNSASVEDGMFFSAALNKYHETWCAQAPQCLSSYDRSPFPENHNSIPMQELVINVPQDTFFGASHGTIESLVKVKGILGNKVLTGMQILDYPEHILSNPDPCFDNARIRWKAMEDGIKYVDYLIFSKKNVMNFLKKFGYENKLILETPLPVRSFEYIPRESENYVMYAGRINPDRRVDKIIEAISLSKNKPKLVVVIVINEATQDFIDLASRLNVDYDLYGSIPEKKKYELYSRSSAVVNAGYGYCPAGCIIEGMMINKPAAVYDNDDENYRHYRDYVEYGNNNVEEFARAIDRAIESKSNEAGMKYAFDVFSYDTWAKKVSEFIMDLQQKHREKFPNIASGALKGFQQAVSTHGYTDTKNLYKNN